MSADRQGGDNQVDGNVGAYGTSINQPRKPRERDNSAYSYRYTNCLGLLNFRAHSKALRFLSYPKPKRACCKALYMYEEKLTALYALYEDRMITM
jgi:hypothetical protein